MPSTTRDLRPDLSADLHRSGYYPELVLDVLDGALAGEDVVAHLVHVETTFATEVRRHVTVLVLTPSRLISAHVDDHPGEDDGAVASAAATTESIPLARVQSVAVTQVVEAPERHRAGALPTEVTLALGWGAVNRVDLDPVVCPDPQCEADHGLTGTLTPDDMIIRVSAQAEGSDSVRRALGFARALSAATRRPGW
ncbi:MAG: DUF5998 family protein [Cellulomonadaceae bacterium]